ncbi:MAG: ABC transporter substrate-binding protein [Peptoniphilus sp.]|nr:ABC transporter substrate-binding protein [Peptoniphilus sp.]MDY3118217.1 ABC transporter substrate-binding protein [Peptoniphilus sp.]
MKRRILFLTLLLLIGCGKKAPSEEAIVGVFEPQQGLYGETGRETFRGVKLAHDLRPVAGGKKISLSLYDTKSQSFESANGVSSLADQGAVALIGTFGTDSMNLARPVIRAAKIPTVTGSTSRDLKRDYWITPVCMNDNEQAQAMAAFASDTLGLRDVAVIVDGEMGYGTALAYAFTHSLPPYVRATTIHYHTGETRFQRELARLKNIPIDGIYCPGDAASSAYLIRAIKDAGIRVPLMGADRWENPSFKSIGKSAVEGAYFTAHYARYETFNRASDAFLRAYEKAYHREPTGYAAMGYDAYNLIADAMNKAGPDRSAVARYLRHLDTFDGALGISKRYDTRNVPIMRQKGNKASYVTSVEVDS